MEASTKEETNVHSQAAPPPRLRERYEAEIVDALTKKFGYSSRMQVPDLVKITLNMGVGDAKQSTPVLEAAMEQLATIAGQKPSVRRARKSIASFKLRDGMPVGVAVTLRGARKWEFLDRLISIAIPRIRDFRGMNPRSFDGRGNYSMGIREQLIFPEIDYDSVDEVRGLDVTITTTAPTDEEGFELLLAMGFPFAHEGRPGQVDKAAEKRKSSARKKRVCAPKPSRPRSSSSRKKTPRPTRRLSARARMAKKGKRARAAIAPSPQAAKRLQTKGRTRRTWRRPRRSSSRAASPSTPLASTIAVAGVDARAPTTASSASAASASARPRTRATCPE